MRKWLAVALNDIRTLIAESPMVDAHRLVHRVRLRMMAARIELDELAEMDCQYDAEGNERSVEDAERARIACGPDIEMEFIQLCYACWGLSTCTNQDLMEMFAHDQNTGYPVFADDTYTVEYEPNYIEESEPERLYAAAFPIHRWVELYQKEAST